MSQQTIGIGTAANDGTGDPLRTAFNKSNLNFTDLYTGASGLLAKSGAAVAHTGDALEFTFATVTIPANTLGANGVLRVSSLWSMTGSANNKTFKHHLGGVGGTSIGGGVMAAVGITGLRVDITLIAANATNAQNAISMAARGSDSLVTEANVIATSVDMTASTTLVLTGQLTTTSETITLLGYVVEYIA